MNLPDPPDNYRWRIRRVYLVGVDTALLALTLERDTLLGRIFEQSFGGNTVYATEATDEYFEEDAQKVLTRFDRWVNVEPTKAKHYTGRYEKTDDGYRKL